MNKKTIGVIAFSQEDYDSFRRYNKNYDGFSTLVCLLKPSDADKHNFDEIIETEKAMMNSQYDEIVVNSNSHLKTKN